MPPATRLCKIPYKKRSIVDVLTFFLDKYSVLEVMISLADIIYCLLLGKPSLIVGQVFTKGIDNIPQ